MHLGYFLKPKLFKGCLANSDLTTSDRELSSSVLQILTANAAVLRILTANAAVLYWSFQDIFVNVLGGLLLACLLEPLLYKWQTKKTKLFLFAKYNMLVTTHICRSKWVVIVFHHWYNILKYLFDVLTYIQKWYLIMKALNESVPLTRPTFWYTHHSVNKNDKVLPASTVNKYCRTPYVGQCLDHYYNTRQANYLHCNLWHTPPPPVWWSVPGLLL